MEDAGKKVRANFVRGLIHDVADYSLAIVCFIMVSMLNDLHMSFLWIFLAVWVYDIGCCLSLMRMCATAKDDIVCGINHRNAYENLCIASETAGFLYKYAFLFPVAIIWNGPVQLVYFYKKEWNTVSRSAFAIIVMTMLQGLFWAYIYTVGHNGMIARIIEYFG